MKITVLCTSRSHAIFPYLIKWVCEAVEKGHEAELIDDKSQLIGGDILFLVSCSQMISALDRKKFTATLVLHASDLPNGRGWSPHIWSILNGADKIQVCLLEASEPVDTGAIWLKTEFELQGHELLEEINTKLFSTELLLMNQALSDWGCIAPKEQNGSGGSFCRKRTPADSRLDPNKSISEQFDLLRTVDSERYPAFFDHRGHRYILKIQKEPNYE